MSIVNTFLAVATGNLPAAAASLVTDFAKGSQSGSSGASPVVTDAGKLGNLAQSNLPVNYGTSEVTKT